ncbi:universal stress protein [Candidatus Providencia siddallii]|uniref:Universal stress protein n=1 Tax=Candidatus Providencia siddallii TaxID=1715285 RepID=A0ABM9NPA2_9GAMM
MYYKHILVAIDLSPDSEILIKKAISIAKPYQSKVSVIHVDINYLAPYTGIININKKNIKKDKNNYTNNSIFKDLVMKSGYCIEKILIANGDLCQVLEDVVKKYNINVVICGHHQDFWSKLTSSARKLIDKIQVDILIVPLNV